MLRTSNAQPWSSTSTTFDSSLSSVLLLARKPDSSGHSEHVRREGELASATSLRAAREGK